MRHSNLCAALLASALTAACSSTSPRPDLPPDVDGYICSHLEITAGGEVSAVAYPDYLRGGYSSLTMKWVARRDGTTPDAHAVWTAGREAISPPGWLTVESLAVDEVPPLHTKTRLQLSSGEFEEREFIEPKQWASSKKSEGRFRFGGSVSVRDVAFIEKFGRATWADVSVVDPSGTVLVRHRLDLGKVAEALARMRELGEQVTEEIADYRNRCTAIPHQDQDISEIVLTTRPAEGRATRGSTRTGISGSAPRPAAGDRC